MKRFLLLLAVFLAAAGLVVADKEHNDEGGEGHPQVTQPPETYDQDLHALVDSCNKIVVSLNTLKGQITELEKGDSRDVEQLGRDSETAKELQRRLGQIKSELKTLLEKAIELQGPNQSQVLNDVHQKLLLAKGDADTHFNSLNSVADGIEGRLKTALEKERNGSGLIFWLIGCAVLLAGMVTLIWKTMPGTPRFTPGMVEAYINRAYTAEVKHTLTHFSTGVLSVKYVRWTGDADTAPTLVIPSKSGDIQKKVGGKQDLELAGNPGFIARAKSTEIVTRFLFAAEPTFAAGDVQLEFEYSEKNRTKINRTPWTVTLKPEPGQRTVSGGQNLFGSDPSQERKLTDQLIQARLAPLQRKLDHMEALLGLPAIRQFSQEPFNAKTLSPEDTLLAVFNDWAERTAGNGDKLTLLELAASQGLAAGLMRLDTDASAKNTGDQIFRFEFHDERGNWLQMSTEDGYVLGIPLGGSHFVRQEHTLLEKMVQRPEGRKDTIPFVTAIAAVKFEAGGSDQSTLRLVRKGKLLVANEKKPRDWPDPPRLGQTSEVSSLQQISSSGESLSTQIARIEREFRSAQDKLRYDVNETLKNVDSQAVESRLRSDFRNQLDDLRRQFEKIVSSASSHVTPEAPAPSSESVANEVWKLLEPHAKEWMIWELQKANAQPVYAAPIPPPSSRPPIEEKPIPAPVVNSPQAVPAAQVSAPKHEAPTVRELGAAWRSVLSIHRDKATSIAKDDYYIRLTALRDELLKQGRLIETPQIVKVSLAPDGARLLLERYEQANFTSPVDYLLWVSDGKQGGQLFVPPGRLFRSWYPKLYELIIGNFPPTANTVDLDSPPEPAQLVRLADLTYSVESKMLLSGV